MTRLIVFDLDGTLVDSTRDLATAVNAVLQALSPATPRLSIGLVRSLIGNGARNLVEESLKHAGLALTVDEILPLFLEHYRGCLLETTRLYPGVLAGLTALSDRTLAVLSNKPGEMCRTILSGLGVSGLFARIAGAGDLPGRKPDPAVLLRLIQEMGFAVEETVMVGDSAVDVKTARAAGVRVYGVAWGLDPTSLVAARPDGVLQALRELADLC